ncbi:hypothetical protein ACFL3J_00815 [Candidatus Omnitrophota bacterium]
MVKVKCEKCGTIAYSAYENSKCACDCGGHCREAERNEENE